MFLDLLHPWALGVGGAALALPFLIHWLTRPRPMRFPLSTIRFVSMAVQQRRSRQKLRDLVILLLRALAVAAIAWAFARPQASRPRLISPADTVEATRVVLLDVSQSMAARVQGIEAFERARARASDFLSYRGGLAADLLLAAARPRSVFSRPSTNFESLREALAKAHVRPERLDVPAALRQASETLAGSTHAEDRRLELVIVSDFQSVNWSAADFSVLPVGTRVQLESVLDLQPPDNVGILRVETAAGTAERTTAVTVEIGNYSEAARSVDVEVQLGGATLHLVGACSPFQKTTLTGDVPAQPEGWRSGKARLVDVEDALAADDERRFVVHLRPVRTFALITRQRDDRRATSSNLLERALAPAARSGAAMQRVVRLDAEHLDRESLAPADAIVLDHPGKLGDDAIALIASLLQRGRAGLYVAAEPVDATNLKLLADAAGAALQLPVEFIPPAADRPRVDLRLAELRRESRVLSVFGDELSALTAPLRLAGGLASRRIERGLEDDVLARFNDQSAAIVLSSCGTGSLAVINADLTAGDLPASPLFVPLLAELTGRTAGDTRAATTWACGEALVAYLPPEAGVLAGLNLRAENPALEDLGFLREEKGGIVWEWNTTGPPGVYTVGREEPVYAVAAAIPSEESDLRGLSDSALRETMTGGRSVAYHAADAPQDNRDDRWTWFASACALLLMCELAALKAFRT